MSAAERLHAPLRPRRGRIAGWVSAIAVVLVLGVPALALNRSGPGEWTWIDRGGILAVVVVVAGGLLRLAAVRAVPGERGVTVHNLVVTRDLVWTQIVTVRFGGDSPWAVLDLDDGDTLAVMGVQRADGAYGRAEAERLATLVALHSGTPRDDEGTS
jgi:hypothetical protein